MTECCSLPLSLSPLGRCLTASHTWNEKKREGKKNIATAAGAEQRKYTAHVGIFIAQAAVAVAVGALDERES
jgi:hypothetical protein